MEGGEMGRDPDMEKKLQGNIKKTCEPANLVKSSIGNCLQKCMITCGEGAKPLDDWAYNSALFFTDFIKV